MPRTRASGRGLPRPDTPAVLLVAVIGGLPVRVRAAAARDRIRAAHRSGATGPTTSAPAWRVAVPASLLFAALVAIPTDLIDTPVFSREIPPTWWAWPALATSSVLAGLLVATFAATPFPERAARQTSARRGGYAGGVLTFFAVGCPVCNKLVLVALGSAGAITWFEPVQPLLQFVGIALLAWALRVRLRDLRSCRSPLSTAGTVDA